ncbi:Phospholipase/Carboxylesterase-like protein 2 [Elsinoe fawcettii]|nr:Phospholipase/Carboxylesterase-like protein 2 [Elsinoe fawcettii]
MTDLKYDEVPPITVAAKNAASIPEHTAAVILLHGLGSKADEWTWLSDRLQSQHPHLSFHLPTAPFNPTPQKTAWLPPLFSGDVPPTTRPSPVEQDDLPSLLASIDYLDGLISSLVKRGIPPNRIVLAGFSQGGIISLLHLLISEKFSGRLAGVVGLCGYLPVKSEVQSLRTQRGLAESVGMVPVFLGQGTEDQWVPKWMWEDTLQGLKELGVDQGVVEPHEYPGGHEVGAKLIEDLGKWFGKVLPKLE